MIEADGRAEAGAGDRRQLPAPETLLGARVAVEHRPAEGTVRKGKTGHGGRRANIHTGAQEEDAGVIVAPAAAESVSVARAPAAHHFKVAGRWRRVRSDLGAAFR